jgi:hypothetical protein
MDISRLYNQIYLIKELHLFMSSYAIFPSMWNRALFQTGNLAHTVAKRTFTTDTTILDWKKIPQLHSPTISKFQDLAFKPALPYHLPKSINLPATKKWFQRGPIPRLNHDYLTPHNGAYLPMELTSRTEAGVQFKRSTAPLSVFLYYMNLPRTQSNNQHGIYIAQAPLDQLPPALQADLPTPELIQAGRGDVYDSSLWLGLAQDARTPLHRDPNPNLFVQVVGAKRVRLLPPNIGGIVLGSVRAEMQTQGIQAESGIELGGMRGEEMMGEEGRLLDEVIWNERPLGGEDKEDLRELLNDGCEAFLYPGDALFIPAGWWHAIQAIGEGVNASVSTNMFGSEF